jgi:hypothetical protein
MYSLLIGLLMTTWASAWTLNNNFGASFKNNLVNVFIDAGTVCPTNGLTVNDLEGLIGPAVSNFWNKVPTSKLRLKPSGFSDAIFTMNEGRLCSPTDPACITAGTNAGNDGTPQDGLIPAVNEIVIACNNNPLNFGGPNVLAVTIPNKFSGKKITGAVILINEGSSSFGNLSRSDQIAVIAHEIGHAIGLGHSEVSSALMYYRTVDQRKRLGQDDIDGVSFLYPIKVDGCGFFDEGLIGGIHHLDQINKRPPGNPPFVQMGITLVVLIFMFEILKLLKRSKTSSAA